MRKFSVEIELLDIQGNHGGNKTIPVIGDLVMTFSELYEVYSDGDRVLLVSFDKENRLWRDAFSGLLWSDFNININERKI